jgi:hypothetical protein
MHFDLRGRDLEEVTDFIFGHPVPDDAKTDSDWWWEAEIVFEPTEHTANLTAIFQGAERLQSRFRRDQLEQGFWFLISGASGALEDVLWNTTIPWSARAKLIEATVDLYRKLFAQHPLDTSAYMFWDALAYGYCVPTRHPETDAEDRRIQDAMFAALQQILNIDSLACQLAALHGLGHLRHPDTESIITKYLERNPELSEENRKFALACIAGTIK